MSEYMKRETPPTPEELLSQYTPLVYHIVSAYLTDYEDRKECVNEVFFAFYQKIAHLDFQEGNFASYLAAIAKNKAISYYRKNKRRKAMIAPDIDPDGICSDAVDSGMEDEIAARVDLEEALSKLAPEELDLIRKKYYQGMTIQEIAASMNLPYETVKKRHQRSITKLRLILLLVLLAALLAGCAYLVARYFGVIPGYGVTEEKDAAIYRMPESVSVEMPEAGLVANITSAVYQDGRLQIRFQLYKADGEPYLTASTTYQEGKTTHLVNNSGYDIRLNQDPMEAYRNLLTSYRTEENGYQMEYQPLFYAPALCTTFDSADNVTISLACDFFLVDYSYSDERNENGTYADWKEEKEVFASFETTLTLKRLDEESLEQYAYTYTEENGGVLVIPRLENGELIVEIYPIQGEYGCILPSVTEHSWYKGIAEDSLEPGSSITVTAEDGTVLKGTRVDSADSETVFFSQWNFGLAEPGTYTLHIPYLLKFYYDQQRFEIPLDITNCMVEKKTYRFEEGSFRIVNIEPITWAEVAAGAYPKKFIPEWYYNPDYGTELESFNSPGFSDEKDLLWKIDLETNLDASGEYLTNLNLNATRDVTNTMDGEKNFVLLTQMDYANEGRLSYLLSWINGKTYRNEEPYDEMYLTMQGLEYDVLLGVGSGSIARWNCNLSLELEVE